MKKQINIKNKLLPILPILLIVIIWQVVSVNGAVPSYMLPSPGQVAKAFVEDIQLLMSNTAVSLLEAFIGLFFGIAAGLLLAIIMDKSVVIEKMLGPLLLISQTVPTVAIAPILVLWFGYGIAPKIVLIFITCFFPITIGILSGFKQADTDAISLLKSMGAGRIQIYRHIKFPGALPTFFSNLKISVAYAFVGAVIAEWLGGDKGLGVYMTRVRKAYAYDKMFAVIILITAISLLLIAVVTVIEKISTPWRHKEQ